MKILILLFLIPSFAASQSFLQGAGIGLAGEKSPGYSTRPSVSIIYSPRMLLLQSDFLSMSASIDLPIFMGVSLNCHSTTGRKTSTANLTLLLPIILNANFATGSYKTNDAPIGYFLGGGFGMHIGAHPQRTNESLSASNYGPVGNIGIRVGLAKQHQKNLEIRFIYLKGLVGDSHITLYSLGTIFNF